MLAQRKSNAHAQLERRFRDSPREPQSLLKHFWEGISRVSNASHGEMLDIWKQLLPNCCLLISAVDWMALLTWGVASVRLRRGGPLSSHDFDEFYELYRLAIQALRASTFNRSTSKASHSKLENNTWNDVVHQPQGIVDWGMGFDAAFYEQLHELVLKRCVAKAPPVPPPPWCFHY